MSASSGRPIHGEGVTALPGVRDTATVCRQGKGSARRRALIMQRTEAMEEEYVTFTASYETLRHADLFPSLVSGIGVCVRHRDSRVCHSRDGHTRDLPHTP